jgi:hypothetical protein
MDLQSIIGHWPIFYSFLILCAVGRTPCTGDQTDAKPQPAHRITHQLQPTNSVILVRARTIPTELPPLVGEVRANFCG